MSNSPEIFLEKIFGKLNVNSLVTTYSTFSNLVFSDGTVQTSANTGSGNTGDITFSGVKMIGAGTASGDGNGYSTLELVPDSDLYDNDQYLIIDPTAPSHIHIRPGGEQDNSGAELFLGGEEKYVRVNSAGVRLQNITTNDNNYGYESGIDFSSGSWYASSGNYFVQFTTTNTTMQSHAFDFTDNMILNELSITYGEGTISTVKSAGSASNLGSNVYRVGVDTAPPSSPTIVTYLDFRLFTTNTTFIEIDGNDIELSSSDDVRIYSRDIFRLYNSSSTDPIELITDSNDQEYTWSFGENGMMGFPQGGTFGFTSTVPSSSIGASGDKQGTIAFNSTYFYYCTADYDGIANIWKRIQWSNDTW